MVVCAKLETVGRRYGKQGWLRRRFAPMGRCRPPAEFIIHLSRISIRKEGKVVRGGPFLFPPIFPPKNEGGGNNVTGGHNGAKKVDG